MQFSNLVSLCDGELLQLAADRPIETLLIDSRKAVLGNGSLFFAVKGERHDGHTFLHVLYSSGLRQFIVEDEINKTLFPGANILKVKSSLEALQKIAAHHRSGFQIPVIGITGSNGKTIVKEWLYQVLSPELKIIKNPGSYNSQVGVPLSVWQMQAHHELGIFEAGISKPGEMANLEVIIKPTIGIFTNLGTAHDEGFASHEEKAIEKAKLFDHVECAIHCKDHDEVAHALKGKSIKTFTWGRHRDADIRVMPLADGNVEVNYQKFSFTLHLPFHDTASRENAFHVMAYMLLKGFHSSIIEDRLKALKSIAMRLELKQGINHCTIIDDSYNNDLAGLRLSLDFLKNQQRTKKTLLLSDILQSGLPDKQLMKEIGELIASGQVKKFIGIGPSLTANISSLPIGTFYTSAEKFLEEFRSEDFADETILVKGARPFHLEKIVQRLQLKVHGTVMEINLGAMVSNLNYFKSLLKPGTKLMAMVKAFAYGSGSEEVANLLQYHRVDYLGVAYADEGIELRKNNITLPIMVMNPSEESFQALLEYKLEPEIYSLRILKGLIEFIREGPITIHLKLDTGMHRLGFESFELAEVIRLLLSHKNIRVASVFSHLSGADEKLHDEFSQQQANSFVAMADALEAGLGYASIRHLLNSSGIIRFPKYQFDMVRLGIGLYGVDPTEGGGAKLKQVATLKTIVSQIKTIKAGNTVGYGRKGFAQGDMKLATLAIGYADGYSRSFSLGNGKVLIHGRLAPVVGNVCMDMTMVDITDIPVKEGDEAIIFGDGLPIQHLAQWSNTIPYEILTSTSERIKRVFFADSI